MSSSAHEFFSRAPLCGGVRFAPSPTGIFHVGNLRTAWISERLARRLGQPWVVRFEDIDRPRTVLTAQARQLENLAALGLVPDQILVQTSFEARHWSLFNAGIRSGQIYACHCSRKTVQTAMASLASAPQNGQTSLYNGHCRDKKINDPARYKSLAWRFRNQNPSGQDDFIVARTNAAPLAVGPDLTDESANAPGRAETIAPATFAFVPSYHFACAVDDFVGNYRLLVRAVDLQPAAALQRSIMAWLKSEADTPSDIPPAIYHTALVTQNDGQRLEKRTGGVTLSELAANGVSAAELVSLFKKSFDVERAYDEIMERQKFVGATAGLFFEPAQSLTLAELGVFTRASSRKD